MTAAQVSAASERRVVDRAERLRQSGRHDDARAELIELLGRAPASADALALLYELTSDLGDLAAFLPFAEAADAAVAPPVNRIRNLWIQALIQTGQADSALSVAERWAEGSVGDESAILALSLVTLETGDLDEAIDILREAADEGWGTRAVQLRRADLLVDDGRIDDATGVWVSLLSTDDPAIDDAEEDLARATDGKAALAGLVEALDRPGPGARSGALLAVRLDDPLGGRRLAARVSGEDRAQFLREYVREADLSGNSAEVAWAASELVFLSPRPVDKLRWLAMAADRSLAAGDTTAAREAFTALASETDPGAGPHDVATRRLFELLAADPTRLDEAIVVLDRYGQEYPDSIGSRAVMYGLLAEGRARGGDIAGGERTLADARRELGVGSATEPGPPDLGSIDAAGARLAFWAGARDSAISRIGRSLGQRGLAAADRTDRIQLLTTLQAADSTEALLAGAAAYGLHRDPTGFDMSATLRELAGALQSPGRAAALIYLGGLAQEADRADVAAGLWRRVVTAFPLSSEAPAAILALARSSDTASARQWLEQLIVGYPESALAPVARRLLAELNEGDIGG